MYYGKSKGVYLSLVINDWSGDALYVKNRFLDLLRDFEVIEENEYKTPLIIRLKLSGILLYIIVDLQGWRVPRSKAKKGLGLQLQAETVGYTVQGSTQGVIRQQC